MPINFLFQPGDQVQPGLFFSKDDGVFTLDLGTDPSTGLSYSLFCSLAPQPGGFGTMEFAFWIADYDPETNYTGKIWDGAATKHLIQGEHRPFVLYVVGEALRVFTEHFKPQCVFMQTMLPDLPDTALAKYYQLGEVLTAAGYQFGRVDSYHGQQAWLAMRLEQ